MIKFIGSIEDLIRHGFVIKEISATKEVDKGVIFVNTKGWLYPKGYMSDNLENKSFDIMPYIWEMISERLVVIE